MAGMGEFTQAWYIESKTIQGAAEFLKLEELGEKGYMVFVFARLVEENEQKHKHGG